MIISGKCYYVIDRAYYCTQLTIIEEDFGDLVYPVAVESLTTRYLGETYSGAAEVMLNPNNWAVCNERKYVKKNVTAYFVEV